MTYPKKLYVKSVYCECKYCGCPETDIYTNGPHYELICTSCNKHLQFISKGMLDSLPDIGKEKEEVTLETINFKLDLILEHLGITEVKE